MTLGKILAPLSGRYDPDNPVALDRPALAAAFAVGRRFDAHVEVFCMEAELHGAHGHVVPGLPGSEVDKLIDAIETENRHRRKAARAVFDELVEQGEVPLRDSPADGPSFSAEFVEQVGGIAAALAARGRLADLIVTANTPADEERAPPPMLEVALQETGRPVLVAPSVEAAPVLSRIAVAWDGSRKAARAVALAQPFLAAAGEVVVISVDEGNPKLPGADNPVDYFAWAGIHAHEIRLAGSAHTAGDILLAQATEAEADLLVMGARLRGSVGAWFFGSATGAVLDRAALPVLMAY